MNKIVSPVGKLTAQTTLTTNTEQPTTLLNTPHGIRAEWAEQVGKPHPKGIKLEIGVSAYFTESCHPFHVNAATPVRVVTRVWVIMTLLG